MGGCQGRIPRGGKIAAMPYLKTDDRARIYYEEHGTGTPLVLAYGIGGNATMWDVNVPGLAARHRLILWEPRAASPGTLTSDRKSTRLNSSHVAISYAVFCLKKKKAPPET